MKENKKPRYFDPYIYKKVLEDAWLPPIAKEILKPWSVSHKHRFLFNEFKERAEQYFKAKQEFIDSLVIEEIYYKLDGLFEYIGTSEEEKHEWFEQLRKDFNLPLDYKFE